MIQLQLFAPEASEEEVDALRREGETDDTDATPGECDLGSTWQD